MINRFLRVAAFIIAGAFLVYYFSENEFDVFIYSLLILILLIAFVRNVIEYVKTRKGDFCIGTVIEATRINKGKDGDDQMVIVEFVSPLDQKMYQIKHRNSFFSKFSNRKEVKVWVDKRNIHKSVVLEKFNNYWVVNMVQLLALIIVLFVFLIISLTSTSSVTKCDYSVPDEIDVVFLNYTSGKDNAL